MPAVTVFDQNGTALFNATDVALPGSSSPHISFDFATPLAGQSLRIFLDIASLKSASDNVGMDNVTIGQTPIPAPAGAALLAPVMLAGAVAAYRRRQRG